MSIKPKAHRSTDAFSLGVLILALIPGVGAGQTMSGNLTVVNGLVRGAASGSVFASAGGVGSASSGVASGSSASAIGNNLNVVVQGNDNVVIVNSTQTNTGAITATTDTNGK